MLSTSRTVIKANQSILSYHCFSSQLPYNLELEDIIHICNSIPYDQWINMKYVADKFLEYNYT